MERIVIVDANDNPIALKGYAEVTYEDIYQVSALWLTDAKSGDSLIAQRKWTKHNDPGKWAAAVAGTVDEGETYEENIVKEIEEEIGLNDLKLTKGPKQFIDDGQHKFFCQWFVAQLDKENTKITIQQDEVEAVKWVTREELAKDITENPDKYTPSTKDSLQILGIL